MLGERIKAARAAQGLSQRKLAEMVGVSAQAISKYERGLDIPSTGVLLKLAGALGVSVDYFARPRKVERVNPAWRARRRLRKKDERKITAKVADGLERYLQIEEIVFGQEVPEFRWPDIPKRVTSLEETESAAEELRRVWNLGSQPIENLVELLEDKGVRILSLGNLPERFDACAWSADGFPVIAVRSDIPGDRQRLSVAHELGHILLEPVGIDPEKACFRFGAAFLVPAEELRQDLGSNRHSLDLFELHLLKHKYKVSMQALVYRARDLGIISESTAQQLFSLFRKMGWHVREPGDQIPSEEPQRLTRLVLRALAEDTISRSRAAELLGEPLGSFLEKLGQKHQGLAAFLAD